MLGHTWQRTLDAALDKIAAQKRKANIAADALELLIQARPDLADDPHLLVAVNALT